MAANWWVYFNSHYLIKLFLSIIFNIFKQIINDSNFFFMMGEDRIGIGVAANYIKDMCGTYAKSGPVNNSGLWFFAHGGAIFLVHLCIYY